MLDITPSLNACRSLAKLELGTVTFISMGHPLILPLVDSAQVQTPANYSICFPLNVQSGVKYYLVCYVVAETPQKVMSSSTNLIKTHTAVLDAAHTGVVIIAISLVKQPGLHRIQFLGQTLTIRASRQIMIHYSSLTALAQPPVLLILLTLY